MPVILKKHVLQLLAVILFDRHLVKIYSFVVHLLIARTPSVFRLLCAVMDAPSFLHDSPPVCVLCGPHHRSFHDSCP